MKILIKLFFWMISQVSPKLAGKLAFGLFQTTRKIKMRERERVFYKSAHNFKISYYLEDIDCYEIGNTDGKPVLLVHGWDSHAGSMGAIAMDLAEKGYHVFAFNLPAHGSSKLKRANLKICKEVFTAVMERINSARPISIVAHSFGSAVTAYSLSNSRFSVDKIVFLTNPNKLSAIFRDFSKFIGISIKGHSHILKLTQELLGEPVENISIEDYGKKVKYKGLLLIHDYCDKIIPYQNSVDVRSKWTNAEMITYHKIGHYRMLWNENVILDVSNFLEAKTFSIKEKDRLNVLAS